MWMTINLELLRTLQFDISRVLQAMVSFYIYSSLLGLTDTTQIVNTVPMNSTSSLNK